MTELVFNQELDKFLENLPIGSVRRSIGNNLYGINFRQTPTPVPRNKDHYGYTFFVRPQLNLDLYNLSNYRGFMSLLTDNALSYQRYTRLSLDPRLGYRGDPAVQDGGGEPLACPLLDKQSPFMAVLTNNLVSLSGFPDLIAPTKTSETGVYGEEWTATDGVMNHYEAYDIDATFRNTRGNPLIYMFYVWIKYQTLVYEGVLNPYLDFILENTIDYNTRVYRIVVDHSKRFVTHIACTGASYPINVPSGAIFDYNVDQPLNLQNKEFSIRLRSMGFLAFEEYIKLKFNETTAIFNPAFRKLLNHDLNGSHSDEMVLREDPRLSYTLNGYSKIPYVLGFLLQDDQAGIPPEWNIDHGIRSSSQFFNLNHRATPWINLVTGELEWWVKSEYMRPFDFDFKEVDWWEI